MQTASRKKSERHVVPKIARQAMDSSVIRSAGYDSAHAVLEVEFVTGHVYRYHAVPRRDWRGLMEASSKGTYFTNYIREKYPANRVD